MLLEAQWIKQTALALGLDACGLAVAAPIPRSQWGLTEWLADGRQADMHYMEEHVPLRYDPTLLLPGARTVISVLLGYKPSSLMQGPVKIAQYAYGEDYHERLKRMMYQFIARLKELFPDVPVVIGGIVYIIKNEKDKDNMRTKLLELDKQEHSCYCSIKEDEGEALDGEGPLGI